MTVIPDNPFDLGPTSLAVELLHRWQLTDDVLRRLRHFTKGCSVLDSAAIIPGSDAACQNALNGAFIELEIFLFCLLRLFGQRRKKGHGVATLTAVSV